MKKKILIILTSIFVLLVIVIVSLYIANSAVREWMDIYIFRKNVIQEDLPTILLENENSNIYAYDNHIVVLQDNKLIIYNTSGKEERTINVSITTPIFKSCGKYLILAEKNGKNVYLIYNTELQWQKSMEGNVSKVAVNKNGSVGVVLTGTTHKSVIVMYGLTGTEEFKTYLASTVAIDLSISEDSRFLSFAEINTSGTTISSAIKTVSVEKARTAPAEAIIYKYEPEKNGLVVNIQYYKDKLICQYDNTVYTFKDGESKKILDIDNKTLFTDIDVIGYICNIVETSSGILSSEYEAKVVNPENSKENTYFLESMPKSLICSDTIIGINMGNKIEFINHSAWLLKSFTSKQSFKDVVIGDGVIGIIYKDRVEIISI